MSKYSIRDWCDLYQVQRGIRTFASSLGFPSRECVELAIVASELASNILKYAGTGTIEATAVADPRGLALVAADGGQPFRDLAAALQDGWNDEGPIDPMHMLSRRGIGGGLGAIVRLSHSFRVETEPAGKKIHVVRYLQAPPGSKKGI